MLVDYNAAQKVFEQLPLSLQSPYLHPFYVLTDASRDCTLEPIFFVCQTAKGIFYYPFHLGCVCGSRFLDIQSSYGYGGPLSSTLNREFLAAAWQHYSAWCKENQVLAEFTRFHPLVQNHLHFSGAIHHVRQTVWVDCSGTSPSDPYLQRVRTSVRKARKNGLEVKWVHPADFYSSFYDLYIQTMDRIGADKFYYFPLKYFRQLAQWEHCRLALCVQGNTWLAAAIFLQMGPYMEYHLAANTPQGNRLGASSLILDQAINLAQRSGCLKFHLGGGTDGRPDNPLLFFKSGFSRERADYYIAKTVYNPESYHRLREQWQNKYQANSDRLLFYRYLPRHEGGAP